MGVGVLHGECSAPAVPCQGAGAEQVPPLGRGGGHRVERILVRRRVDGPAREMLRKHGTYFVVDCATVPEVAQLVDLATLVPEQRTRE
jgi:hypothetical protein